LKLSFQNSLRIAVSLLLIILAGLAASDWRIDANKFRKNPNRVQALNDLKKEAEEYEYEDILGRITKIEAEKNVTVKAKMDADLQDLIDSYALSEGLSPDRKAGGIAKTIKADRAYNAERQANASTWIEDAFRRLKGDNNVKEATEVRTPPSWLGGLLHAIFWGIILVAAAGLVFLITRIPFGSIKARKAKSGGLLEEGELLLSEDEYLKQADELIANGRFREACRALYLATLLRVDAIQIARFESTQTNWEHLRRIETSSRRPEGIGFREVTKAFDLAWYGYQAKSVSDVDIFRTTYLQVKAIGVPSK
jgi:hypothetical protein